MNVMRKLVLSVAAVLWLSVGSANAAIIDLGFALDRSGSVGAGNWGLVTSGLANALSLIPTAGPDQYRVAVASFAATGALNVAPVVLTAANLAAVQAAITGIGFTGGLTCISCATTLLTNAFTAAGFGDTSLLNISTDGAPNVEETNGTTLRGNLVGAGWDSISAEAIGSFDLTFLQNLVYPNPGLTTNNPAMLPDPLVQGFVLTVDNFADYQGAINAKIQRIVVPEPTTMTLLGLSLLGLGVRARRRR